MIIIICCIVILYFIVACFTAAICKNYIKDVFPEMALLYGFVWPLALPLILMSVISDKMQVFFKEKK